MPKQGGQSLSRSARAEIARSSGIIAEYRPGPWKELDSSRMNQARYDASRRELHVVFKDGTPWIYYDIPQNIWDNLRRSASPGKFVNRVLNAFPYSQAPADFDTMDAAAAGGDDPTDYADADSLNISAEEFGDIYGTGVDLFDDRLR